MLTCKRLKDLREDRDLYQREFKIILGITQSNYSKWEVGTRIIPLKYLNKLCNYYNVSMDYLLELTSNKSTKNIIKINNLDKIEIGRRINKIRNDNNLTYRDLAKKLNTTPSTIYAYEKGKTLILTSFAYELCKKYKISLDWLCGRK